MTLRRGLQIVAIIAFVLFLFLVYLPRSGSHTSQIGLSVLSDCPDVRSAFVAIQAKPRGPALVNVSLRDASNKPEPAGKCKHMKIVFPGITSGGEIHSGRERPLDFGGGLRGPNVAESIDAGARLQRVNGLGGVDELDLDLTGSQPVEPRLLFLWNDPVRYVNFASSELVLPLLSVSYENVPLRPVRHVELDISLPADLEDKTITPTPSQTIPLANDEVSTFDFPTGVSLVRVRWIDSVRSAVKDVGIVLLSLIAGWAIPDLLAKSRLDSSEAKEKSSRPVTSKGRPPDISRKVPRRKRRR